MSNPLKRKSSRLDALTSPSVMLPTPDTSQELVLPLRDTAFRELAARYNGVAAQDNTEPYEDQEDRTLARFSEDEELALIKHTPAGFEGERLPAERLADSAIEEQLKSFELELRREDLDYSKLRWAKLYHTTGYRGIARQLMEDEISTLYSKRPTLNEMDLHWTTQAMTDVLESTYPRLLQSVMLGNLAYDRRHDEVLAAILDKLWAQAKYQPGIYHQQHVNEQGLAATPNQLLRATAVMLGYLKGCEHGFSDEIEETITAELANKIDNFKSGSHPVSMDDTTRSPHPLRNYMWTDAYIDRALADGEFVISRAEPREDPTVALRPSRRRNAPAVEITEEAPQQDSKKKTHIARLSPTRIKVAIAFARALHARLEKVSQDKRDEPLKHPIVEVGYSNLCISRLKEHACHRNSNYLMNMYEAIFAVLFDIGDPLFDKPFHIDQTVIYLIYSPEQTEIAEIGWTKLAEGYTANGGGFSHYPAGMSNASVNKTPALVWSAAMAYAITDSALPLHRKALLVQEQKEEVEANDEVRKAKEAYFERMRKRSQIKDIHVSFLKRTSEHEPLGESMPSSKDSRQRSDLKRFAGDFAQRCESFDNTQTMFQHHAESSRNIENEMSRMIDFLSVASATRVEAGLMDLSSSDNDDDDLDDLEGGLEEQNTDSDLEGDLNDESS